MRETHVTLPELSLIVGTRALAGVGLGFLLADSLSAERRRAIGWTLLLIGAATTVPLAITVFGRMSSSSTPTGWPQNTSGGAAEAANRLNQRQEAFARS